MSVNVARPAFVERGRDQSVLAREKTETVVEKKREEVALLRDYALALTQSKYLPDKFFCRVTGRHVPKIEKACRRTLLGETFYVWSSESDREETSVIGRERDPKEEQEAKMKRREANRQMAEKMKRG